MHCECGKPDWPGRCPGPANCPCVDNEPKCRDCGDDTRHRQDSDDTWVCQTCAAKVSRDDILLNFHKGDVPISDPPGYCAEDFFIGGLGWLDEGVFENVADVFSKAEARYRGTDVDGIGIRLSIWDGEEFVRRNLKAG